MKKYHEGELVLCKVTDIVKTTVFVETLDGIKGSIVFSEVAPGRIRNIRVYVVPNKIIVCKVLNQTEDHLFLSLRRVKDKERKDLMEEFKKELTYKSILKKLLGEKTESVLEKIGMPLSEFFEKAKNDLNELNKYFEKEHAEKLKKIIEEKKGKSREIKQEFVLRCKEPDGIIKIKSVLSHYNNLIYLGNSRFVIKISSLDLKKAGQEMANILETIERDARKNKCEFELKKK